MLAGVQRQPRAAAQIAGRHRLDQEVMHFGDGQRKDLVRLRTVRADDDHRDVSQRLVGAHPGQNLPGVDIRHDQIHHHQIGNQIFDGGQPILAASSHRHESDAQIAHGLRRQRQEVPVAIDADHSLVFGDAFGLAGDQRFQVGHFDMIAALIPGG